MARVMISGSKRPLASSTLPLKQKGFSYLLLLFFVAIMGIVLATQGSIYSLARQREKEKELLNAGRTLKQAILSYYNSGPGGTKTYPPNFEVLLQDPRYPTVRRHLRQIPIDPMTNSREWGLKKLATGEIIGVFSRSEKPPLKKANFGLGETDFAGAGSYKGWEFVAVTETTTATPGTGATPVPTPPNNGFSNPFKN